MSRDRKRFYTIEAGMEKVEILDIAARKTIDTFTLSEGNKKVRIRSIEPDPLHRFVMMLTASATKLIDRFEIGAPTLVQYDLKEHKIVRTIPWPNDEERQNANIQFSPDGKLMYLFSDQDVLIYETDNFTQVDKWELSRPIEEGFGRLEFGSRDVLNDEPGFYTGDLQRLRSGPAPPDDGHRPREPGGEDAWTSTRSGPSHRRELRAGARPQGRPTGCSRTSAATSSGSSISSTASWPGAPSSRAGRAWR